MGHLTDRQKKAIITDRVNGMTFRAIAKKYGISATSVQRIIRADPETARKVTEKNEQNTQDMLDYLDVQKGKAQALLTAIIEALNDPEKLARANVRDLATAYGIIVDKFTLSKQKPEEDALRKAKELLGEVDGVIR